MPNWEDDGDEMPHDMFCKCGSCTKERERERERSDAIEAEWQAFSKRSGIGIDLASQAGIRAFSTLLSGERMAMIECAECDARFAMSSIRLVKACPVCQSDRLTQTHVVNVKREDLPRGA